MQRQGLAILKQPDWHDFGPTFAADQLAKRHQIEVGKETLCGWMIDAGMWKIVLTIFDEVNVRAVSGCAVGRFRGQRSQSSARARTDPGVLSKNDPGGL